jgi:hypothetical protein
MGAGAKPVFLSEYGVGSQFDAVTALAEASRHLSADNSGVKPASEPPDVAYVRSMAEQFMADWERFGMDRLYCFPEDALLDSQLHQSRHRSATFDFIRANGNIAGYNLTGMLDHALTGEGAWTYWRRWKPGAMEVTSDGWWPLRWCLDAAPAVSFPGGQLDIELSLADEDVLPSGQYEARLAVVGPEGWRWQRSVELPIEHGRGPLAVPVLNERITLDGGPGRYCCAASLGTAASPAAGRVDIEVIGRPEPLMPRRRAAAFGFAEPALGWFTAHGVDLVPGPGASSDPDLLIVGHANQLADDDWRDVAAAVDRGATAVVLTPWELIAPGEKSATLPFAPSISCTPFHDWLYHKECFVRDTRLASGLQAPGLMSWRRYDQALPRHLLHGDAEDVAAFAVAVGFPCPGGYASGLVAASFRHGTGRVVVSTFDLLAHLGVQAVADQLTVNLLRYATR